MWRLPFAQYMQGSPTYELSKFLCHILTPLTGKSKYHIKNITDWVNIAKSLRWENDEEIVSFDVVSLFTSIPTELAIEIAKGRLNNDSTRNSRTGLSPDDICDMLAFCLNSTQFQFRGKYYKQSQGTAMASPVSVVVANMVMEHTEQKAISPLHVEPKIYFQFVDDTIAAIKKRLIDQFHNHLNAQHIVIYNSRLKDITLKQDWI